MSEQRFPNARYAKSTMLVGEPILERVELEGRQSSYRQSIKISRTSL